MKGSGRELRGTGPLGLRDEQRRVIELLRQARGSMRGIDSSPASLRRRVRELEQEIARLRHGTHGGAA